MTSTSIKYSKICYKYRLEDDLITKTRIRPDRNIATDFIELDTEGNLFIRKRYCWDGCSGPTYDTNTNMRPACNHDAKFQLMRLGLIDRDRWYHVANEEFFEDNRQDGMIWIRAMYYYKCVDKFSYRYTLPAETVILTAP